MRSRTDGTSIQQARARSHSTTLHKYAYLGLLFSVLTDARRKSQVYSHTCWSLNIQTLCMHPVPNKQNGVYLTYGSKSLVKTLSAHAAEHYPSSSIGVYPIDNDSAIALVLVANKYSPNNFWYVKQAAFVSRSL